MVTTYTHLSGLRHRVVERALAAAHVGVAAGARLVPDLLRG